MGSHSVKATHKKARSRVNQSLQHIPVQWDNWRKRSTEQPVGINHIPVRDNPLVHVSYDGHHFTYIRRSEVAG